MDIGQIKQKMDKALSHLEHEFSSLQLGRASTALVENIDIYIPEWDMKQKLNQMWNITIMDSQTLKIECWDKNNISHIEKWIYDSGTWLTPQNMGEYIIISIPPLTTERRKDLTKIVAKAWEDAKVSIRKARQDGMNDIKKQLQDKEISENERDNLENEVDKYTKDYTNKIDSHVKNKSDEIMKV